MTRKEKDARFEELSPRYCRESRPDGDWAEATRIAYEVMELDSSPTDPD